MSTLLVLGIVSLFTLLFLPSLQPLALDHYQFGADYLLCQSQAMAKAQEQDLTLDYPQLTSHHGIHFYPNGYVNLAQTIWFSTLHKEVNVIVELGGGRLVYGNS